MCKSEIKITQHITQQLEAEGHLLGMVAGMKGYTALIVDIIGFSCLKGKTPQMVQLLLFMFNSKKRKKKQLCGSAVGVWW